MWLFAYAKIRIAFHFIYSHEKTSWYVAGLPVAHCFHYAFLLSNPNEVNTFSM